MIEFTERQPASGETEETEFQSQLAELAKVSNPGNLAARLLELDAVQLNALCYWLNLKGGKTLLNLAAEIKNQEAGLAILGELINDKDKPVKRNGEGEAANQRTRAEREAVLFQELAELAA